MIRNLAFEFAIISNIVEFLFSVFKNFMALDNRVISKKNKILQVLGSMSLLIASIMICVKPDEIQKFLNNTDVMLQSEENFLTLAMYYFIYLILLNIIVMLPLRIIVFSLKEWKILTLWDYYYQVRKAMSFLKGDYEEVLLIYQNIVERKVEFLEKSSFRNLTKSFFLGNLEMTMNELHSLEEEQKRDQLLLVEKSKEVIQARKYINSEEVIAN